MVRVIRWPEGWAKLGGGWVCTQGREPHVSARGQLQFADEGLVTHLRNPAPDRTGAPCLQRGVCESKGLPRGYATCPWRAVSTLRSQSSESEVILRQVSSRIWILHPASGWGITGPSTRTLQLGGEGAWASNVYKTPLQNIDHAFLESHLNKPGRRQPNTDIAFNSPKPGYSFNQKASLHHNR